MREFQTVRGAVYFPPYVAMSVYLTEEKKRQRPVEFADVAVSTLLGSHEVGSMARQCFVAVTADLYF
jgi:hypothetical protein